MVARDRPFRSAGRRGVRAGGKAEVGQQDLYEGSVGDQAGGGGGFLDGLAEPGLIQRADEHLMVLQVRYQFGVNGGTGIEISPHPDHYQSWRLPRIHRRGGRIFVRAGAAGGDASRSAQRLDERPAFLLVGALGVDLFELVDDQHQPRLGGSRPRSRHDL